MSRGPQASAYAVLLPIAPMALAVAPLAADVGHRGVWPQVAALLLFPVYYLALHRLVGFAPVEEALNSGHPLDERQSRTYLRWNLPLHWLLGALYLAVALLVLLG